MSLLQKTVKIPEPTWRSLREIAYRQERPMNAVIADAVASYQWSVEHPPLGAVPLKK